jgi:hypothetical protein
MWRARRAAYFALRAASKGGLACIAHLCAALHQNGVSRIGAASWHGILRCSLGGGIAHHIARSGMGLVGTDIMISPGT